MIFRRKNKKILFKRSIERPKRGRDQDIAVARKVKAALTSQKMLYRALVIVFLGIAGYVLLLSPLLQVDAVEITGLKNISANEMRALIGRELAGEYANVLRKNNMLFIQAEGIEKLLLGEFRDMKEVEIKKQFPNRLVVRAGERELDLLFCSGSWCYTIDRDGIAYSKMPAESSEAKEGSVPLLQDGSERYFETGERAMDPEYIKYIKNIREKLPRDIGIEVEQHFFTPHLASGDIRVKTTEGWMLYFDRNIALQKELDMLRAVLKNSVEQEKRKDLEYIDLRTDNKVYFKYITSNITEEKQQETVETQQEKPAEEKPKEKKKRDKN